MREEIQKSKEQINRDMQGNKNNKPEELSIFIVDSSSNKPIVMLTTADLQL